MPNPFLKLKNKAYVEFAVASVIITLMVVALCLFPVDNGVEGITDQTADASLVSSTEISGALKSTGSRTIKTKSYGDKTDKNELTSEADEQSIIENNKAKQTTTGKTVSKQIKGQKTTTWSFKESSNNTGDPVRNFNSVDNFEKYMTSGLTDDQAIVLNQILEGISNFQTDIAIKENVFKKNDLESLKSLFVLIKIACIENSSLDSTYRYAGNNDYITAIQLTYTKSKEKALAEKDQLMKKVDSVLKGITTDMNEFERVEYIHDTINKTCVYGESDTGNQDSAYGCLVEGKAICEGYSKAFLLLCNKAGIDCTIVTGTALSDSGENVSHMWNMVMVDGKWYHIDLTWDDPTLKPLDKSYVRHDFFNLTDSEISKTHTSIKNEFYDYPKANSLKNNYFVYYDYSAYDYDSAVYAMKKAVTKAAKSGNKYAAIKLNNNKTFSYVKKKLFETSNGKTPIFTILKEVKKKTKAEFSTAEISKIFMEETGVITVVLKY